MSLARAVGAMVVAAVAVFDLNACTAHEQPPGRLDRETARRLLSADTLWSTLDVTEAFRLGAPVPYACDNLSAAEEGDGGENEKLRQAGLVQLVDSSAILPDSVAHLCIYRPSDQLQKLSADASTSRPEIVYQMMPSTPGRGMLRIRTALAELDSITGIQQADGAVEASVEFTVRRKLSSWGKRLGLTESTERGLPLRARFERYDDGWRLRPVP